MRKLLAAAIRTLCPPTCHKLFDHYRFEDYAFKVVGVGSVGTRCFVMLFMADSDDPLLLQAKEARPSVLEPYAGKSKFDHHGQRIVVGQRLMQSASDMFLGWMTGIDGIHYYIRQLRDMKFSIPLDAIDAPELARYADVCGWVLARAHAKGGDAAMISGYLGKSDAFDQALSKFALAYADQTEQDYKSSVKGCEIRKSTGDIRPIDKWRKVLIEIFSQSTETCLAVGFSGKVTGEEYQQFLDREQRTVERR